MRKVNHVYFDPIALVFYVVNILNRDVIRAWKRELARTGLTQTVHLKIWTMKPASIQYLFVRYRHGSAETYAPFEYRFTSLRLYPISLRPCVGNRCNQRDLLGYVCA